MNNKWQNEAKRECLKFTLTSAHIGCLCKVRGGCISFQCSQYAAPCNHLSSNVQVKKEFIKSIIFLQSKYYSLKQKVKTRFSSIFKIENQRIKGNEQNWAISEWSISQSTNSIQTQNVLTQVISERVTKNKS